MPDEKAPLTKKERLNRNIMIACLLIGGIIGGVMGFTDTDLEAGSLAGFSDAPLSMPVTIALAIFWGLIMPVIAWFWHRSAIDEQEAAAYRDGAYYAAYVYIIAVPCWWILWRGGILPEPDGVTIFLVFNGIWLATWFWKKYH
jgi:hypothetical protein